MVWTKRTVLFKGRIKKVDVIPSGEAVFKDDEAYLTVRKERLRQKYLIVLGWSLWIFSTTFFFFVILGADDPWFFFMPNGAPLVFLVGNIMDLVLFRKMDSQVIIYDNGVLLRIPNKFMIIAMFLPFDQLNAIERKGRKLLFRGHRRSWLYWAILIDEIGDKGVETIMRRFEGWPVEQRPPRLVVYGPDGHRVEDGIPQRDTGKV